MPNSSNNNLHKLSSSDPSEASYIKSGHEISNSNNIFASQSVSSPQLSSALIKTIPLSNSSNSDNSKPTKKYQRILQLFSFQSLIISFYIAIFASILMSMVFMLFYSDLLSNTSTTNDTAKNPGNFNPSTINQNINSSLSKKDQEIIKSRNLFNKEGSLGDDVTNSQSRTTVKSDNALIKSNLPYKLVGTVYGSTPYNGIAIIQDKLTGNKDSFLVGARLSTHVFLSEIHRQRAILNHNGQLEYIEIDKPKPKKRNRSERSLLADLGPMNRSIPENSKGRISQFKEQGFEFKDNTISMTESYKKKILTQDFSKVLQDAKADPHMVGGKLAGFKLSKIKQDSIYEKSGFANGDIVTEINGIELSSVSQAISVLQAARNSSRLEVTVIQNGQTNTIEINVGQ